MSTSDKKTDVSSDSEASDDGSTEYLLIQPSDLPWPGIEMVWGDMKHHYYLSKNWSPDFYVDLAYNGFISVAQNVPMQEPWLIPEIQKAYCILDFKELHVSKNVRNKCKRGYNLKVNSDMAGVLRGISSYHRSNWVIKPYQEMLLKLQAQGGVKVKASDGRSTFHAVSVELINSSGEIVAGEVGYTIGRTYTSLTGFFKRFDSSGSAESDQEGKSAKDTAYSGAKEKEPNKSSAKYNSAGKIQLVALAKFLHRQGIAFWNLGHPPRPASGQMVYKSEIGGKVVSRREFLKRWCAGRDEKFAGLGHINCDAQDLILGSS